jgi:hypothetical protein
VPAANKPKPPRPPRNDPAARLAALRSLARENGGRCFAEAYPGYQGRADYECKEGHRWTTTSAIILGGSWCPTCRYRGRHKLDDLKALARERGGWLLSREYPEFRGKVRLRCENGHEWETEPRKLRFGHWCPRCRLTLADMDAMVADRGGRCISKQYRGFTSPLRWECARGHRFVTRPRNVKLGTWCRKCKHEDWLVTVREFAAGRGGELVSRRGLEPDRKLRWRCAAGHEWLAVANSVLRGQWCPECIGTRLGIAEMRRMAAEHGGKCLSDRYVDNRTHLQWECDKGHRWWATAGNMRQYDTWCPDCAREVQRAERRSMAKDRR